MIATFCLNGALGILLSQVIDAEEYTVTVKPISSKGPSYEARIDRAADSLDIIVRA